MTFSRSSQKEKGGPKVVAGEKWLNSILPGVAKVVKFFMGAKVVSFHFIHSKLRKRHFC